jgi:hypothetical protein
MARSDLVEMITRSILKPANINQALLFRHADFFAKRSPAALQEASLRTPASVGMRGSSHPATSLPSSKLEQVVFAHHGVRKLQLRKLNLLAVMHACFAFGSSRFR